MKLTSGRKIPDRFVILLHMKFLAPKYLRAFPVLLLFAVLLSACGGELPVERVVQNNWSDGQGYEITFTKVYDNATFVRNINGEETRGTWSITDSNRVIALQFELEDVQQAIDSASYEVSNNAPSVRYFNDGEEVTTFSNGAFATNPAVLNLYIEAASENELVLLDAGNKITLSPSVAEQEIGITMESALRGLLGMLVLILIAFLFSSNRRAINWKVVGIGLACQIVFAFLIQNVGPVEQALTALGNGFTKLLSFTQKGSEFLFGGLMDQKSYGFLFFVQVLPTIIFFSALTSVLFYLGIIQKVVGALAWVMTKLLRISGAESLSVAGNIFLGQTESPLMIKAYLERMNRSEIMLVMTGGMATIAGAVLAAYIQLLGGPDPAQQAIFAKHLLTASFMAAPGAVVLSKILVPQTESIDLDVKVSQEKIGSNILDAMAKGTTEGLKLAANVGAMLLVFIAFLAMIDWPLNWIGEITGLNEWIATDSGGRYSEFGLQYILGKVFAPLMWLLGVPNQDISLVGQLVGEKLIASEFVAYLHLTDLKGSTDFVMSKKAIVMSTFMLCGFANFASIGIQIGGIGSLAPGKRVLLSQLGMRALLGGALASLLSATIIGMFY